VTSVTTMSAREFNHDVSAAKREAGHGPVVITDRGRPAYVLLSIEQYRSLSASDTELVDRLSMDDDLDVEFEPVSVDLRIPDL
jgi:prevent-host-death family protein